MRVIEIIPARVWKNVQTGQTASTYGAVPWTSGADRANWEIVDVGFTWRNDNGTIGLGRPPAKTREEAQQVMDGINARFKR